MQTWQYIPILGVVAVVLYFALTASKRRGAAAEMYTKGKEAIIAAAAAQRRPGETEPAVVVAQMRTTFKGKIFFVALTNQQLFVAEAGAQPRGFERRELSLSVERKTWQDMGNTYTTVSEGWEAKLTLPGNEKHTWRIYDAPDPSSADAQHVRAFLHSAGVALAA